MEQRKRKGRGGRKDREGERNRAMGKDDNCGRTQEERRGGREDTKGEIRGIRGNVCRQEEKKKNKRGKRIKEYERKRTGRQR